MPDIMYRVKGDLPMPSQSATFRRTVAERMEAYRDRVAARIRSEMEHRGEDPAAIAHALHVRERSVERWVNKEAEPRKSNLRALAEHWGIEITELTPDLEEEERQLQAQLDRIEERLDELLERLAPSESAEGDEVPDDPQIDQDDQPGSRDEDEPESPGAHQRPA